MKFEKVIIIGAGPGGLATALQLHRYGIKPLIFEKNQVGGLLRNANLVENYPGFPGGISGSDMVNIIKEQISDYALNISFEKVTQFDHIDNQFLVATPNQVYQSQVAVIATGTKPRKFFDLEIPAESADRVLYEVYPLLDHQGKQIAIVGAGDAAFDYALNLARANDVHILNRGEQISCLPLLWERAKVNPRIAYLANTRISRISTAPEQKLLLECRTPAGVDSMIVHHLIGAIGRDSQLDFMTSQFKQKAIQLETSGKLYYVGDVVNGLYRQTAIAVGNGILAAMKIYQYLKEGDQ
jgi:thioredoxin reductase (NADPH)